MRFQDRQMILENSDEGSTPGIRILNQPEEAGTANTL